MHKMVPLVTIASVLLLAGCSSPTPKSTPKPLQAAGTITVPINIEDALNGTVEMGSPCIAEDGYDDITDGAQVIITNASGKTVGVGSLEPGTVSSTGSKCQFEFTVNGIPAGSKFYGIHIGNQNRGVIQEPADQIGNVQLTLGS
jgi:hypothetical protein